MTTSVLPVAALVLLGISLTWLGLTTALTVVAALRAGGRRGALINDSAFAESRFTAPVSIIIPVHGSASMADGAIMAALASTYPELEVVVVTGVLTGPERSDLDRRWGLSPREYFYRRALPCGEVRSILRSLVDPRLLVVEQVAGGSADALNCGVNLAQYRYVVALDPALRFGPDALLRAMTPALQDPASVVAVVSHVERTDVTADGVGRWLARFERIASMRALLETRVAWRGPATGPGPHDGVVIWRRDALVEAGGFSKHAADPALELIIAMRRRDAAEGCVVARSGVVFGTLDAVGFLGALRTAARRQRSVFQLLARRGASSESGRVRPAIGRLLRDEVLSPLSAIVAVLTAVGGAAAGWFSWLDAVLVIVALSFGRALTADAALLVRGKLRGSPDLAELRRLVAVGPLEFVCYSLPLAAARLVGAVVPHRRT